MNPEERIIDQHIRIWEATIEHEQNYMFRCASEDEEACRRRRRAAEDVLAALKRYQEAL